MAQENVYEMAIMNLSSKSYLQWTTFVIYKKSPVSQFPFLENCHEQDREGLGWESGGQRSIAGCCSLAEILLSIRQGHRQAAHEHAPLFFCGCCSSIAGRFPSHSHRGGRPVQVHPQEGGVQSGTHLFFGAQVTPSYNNGLSTSEPHSFLYSLHHNGSQRWGRGGEAKGGVGRKEPIPPFF